MNFAIEFFGGWQNVEWLQKNNYLQEYSGNYHNIYYKDFGSYFYIFLTFFTSMIIADRGGISVFM